MHRSLILILLGILLAAAPARAVLEPPHVLALEDSTSVRVEKGTEQVRATEYAGLHKAIAQKFSVDAYGRWKTDWLLPEGEGDRIRQDGRWYGALSRPVLPFAALWIAAEGEHFDDRPYNLRPRETAISEVLPRSPQFAAETQATPAPNISSVRILRGGAGATVYPWRPLRADAAVGPVQDRRIGRVRSGLGLWTRAALDHWEAGGWDQTGTLAYNRETPKDHRNEDLAANYEVYREFFEGNSNRAQLSFGTLGRDLFIEATGRTARREERNYRIRDILTYGISRGVRVEMSGEVQHEKTEQSQFGQAVSSLEENQAGFAAAVQGRYRRASGEMRLGMRSVSQTIRGDILQGRKTDLTLEGRTPFPARSTLAMRLAVSKYALDTRNPDNYDDRDELRYNVEASWSKPLLPGLVYEIHGLVRLDHLVYLFQQSSANNRWTRLFLAGSTIQHRPGDNFRQRVAFTVSANYQDYDYDTEPRTTRSTVFRRLVMSDSASLNLSPRVRLEGKAMVQTEEFGRLFWSTFEEERSDETRSVTAALWTVWELMRQTRAGVGGLWDSRRGVRFPVLGKTEKTVFINLRSYGPTFLLERTTARGLFLSLNGRVLRQLQLQRDDRWIVSGELLGGFRW